MGRNKKKIQFAMCLALYNHFTQSRTTRLCDQFISKSDETVGTVDIIEIIYATNSLPK